MRLYKAVALILAFGLATGGECCFAVPQGGASGCPTTYEAYTQSEFRPLLLEIRPLKISLIQGTSEIDVGTEIQPPVPGACFGLFTDKGHSLVASVRAGSDGQFRFEAVPPGRYRLIARAEGLCTANVPLEVVRSSHRRKAEILIHFRAAGIDTCSYAELGPVAAKHTPTTH
jgi:hypothetical protein